MSTGIGNLCEGTTSVHIWHMTLVTVCHPTLPIQPFVRIRRRWNHQGHISLNRPAWPGLHPLYMQQVLDSCRTNRGEIAGKVAEDFYVSLLKAIFLKAQGWTVEPALPYKSNNKGISIAQGIWSQALLLDVARVRELVPVWNILEGVTAQSSGLWLIWQTQSAQHFWTQFGGIVSSCSSHGSLSHLDRHSK